MQAGKVKIRRAHARRQAVGLLCMAAALAACGPADPAADPTDGARAAGRGAEAAAVLTGLDVLLRDGSPVLSGRRVGLVTNHTGIDRDGASGIDLLHARTDFELRALFSPEHSITGRVEAGEHVEGGVDPRTGLPIHSLYGATRRPTAEMLDEVDVLVFDIQDIGTRYYTYVWTMALAMEGAAEHGRDIVVLDRPNPLGGESVQGNVLDPAFSTFVGLYPVPMRHGLTAGELARLLNEEHGIGARLTVIPMEGWRRALWFDATGLPWVAPSPNMPDLESATHYAGTCLFEGTNLSVGRGTDRPFQQVGAPWLDAAEVVRRLERRGLGGVRFEATSFTPDSPGDGKFPDTPVNGVRLVVTDRAAYDPAVTGIALLVEVQALHGDRLEYAERHFDRLAGTDRVRRQLLQGESVEAITAGWPGELAGFNEVAGRHRLYR